MSLIFSMTFSNELRFLLAVLATWRLTHLLAEEDGPWDVVVRLRVWLGKSTLGQALDCFYCLSLWIAAPLALVLDRSLHYWFLTWLAVSGASCLLERATDRKNLTS
jgi:hypothetical protein